MSTSPWLTITNALHCGMRRTMDAVKSSGGSLQVEGILETSRRKGSQKLALLQRFKANPALTRHELRVKLGVLG